MRGQPRIFRAPTKTFTTGSKPEFQLGGLPAHIRGNPTLVRAIDLVVNATINSGAAGAGIAARLIAQVVAKLTLKTPDSSHKWIDGLSGQSLRQLFEVYGRGGNPNDPSAIGAAGGAQSRTFRIRITPPAMWRRPKELGILGALIADDGSLEITGAGWTSGTFSADDAITALTIQPIVHYLVMRRDELLVPSLWRAFEKARDASTEDDHNLPPGRYAGLLIYNDDDTAVTDGDFDTIDLEFDGESVFNDVTDSDLVYAFNADQRQDDLAAGLTDPASGSDGEQVPLIWQPAGKGELGNVAESLDKPHYIVKRTNNQAQKFVGLVLEDNAVGSRSAPGYQKPESVAPKAPLSLQQAGAYRLKRMG